MKLMLAIPTYNRPEVMNWKLWNEYEYYNEYDILVYVFDSSEDDETKKVVDKYKKIINDIHYVKVDPKVHSNKKAYMIFKGEQIDEEYDYIWLCSDSIIWKESVYKKINDNVQKDDYDIIIPNYRDVEKLGTKEYTDKQELFYDCAWHMTLYGATVLRNETILKTADWDFLEKKYFVKERINFSHLGMYFETIKNMSEFRAIHLSLELGEMIPSWMRKHSGWHSEAFRLWLSYWPEFVNSLPDCYNRKNEVILKCNENSGTFLERELVGYKRAKVLSNASFKKWKVNIKKYAPNSYDLFKKVLNRPVLYYDIQNFSLRNIIHTVNIFIWLRDFKKQFDKLYISGSGEYASWILGMCKLLNIKLSGYIKSPLDVDYELELKIGNVKELEDYTLDEKSGIILGMEFWYFKEMEARNMFESIPKHQLFSEYLFHRKGFKVYRD
ncbi:MAG: hypothetical protein K5894_06820 [Lachnospiraceae bacterium]|nr:hypothetical protein [Lachnospiraceae bacterium]